MLITRVHHMFEGDTYFPNFNQGAWEIRLLEEGVVNEKNIYPHSYLQYTRKKKGTVK